jgi:RNA polymerase sigma-70 factor, ECF subfamily
MSHPTTARVLERDLHLLDDERLLEALREGDEMAFMALVDRYGALMLRVAGMYVRTPAVAEEVVQEAWLGVLEGIHRFEGRSSLKTWIFRILSNRAKTRGEREARCTPFSSLGGGGEDDDGPAVDADRFLGPDDPVWPGHWAAAPRDWSTVPDVRLLARETLDRIRAAIAELPDRQQEVIVLRDVEGWSAEEVCQALGVSEVNQRVLLHRARSKVRGALERYLDPDLVTA